MSNISDISQYNAAKVLGFFKELSSVPHGSGNTKAIADICVNFAKERHLDYRKDEVGNVIIFKKASLGAESRDTVIIQGHLDMVCVKTSDCTKNMFTDPIDIMTDGNIIWADKTSLGADDTVAIAIALAILDDDTLQHPPICAVFTVDEETDMSGARNLDISGVPGNMMINIDSEDEGYITCGCAGAIKARCEFSYLKVSPDPDDVFYKLKISGLLGGHSGIEIANNRANAIRLLARLIYGLSLKWNIKLCEFDGGLFDNAIPVSAEAIVSVNKGDALAFESLAAKHEKLFRYEYKNSDPDIKVTASAYEGEVSNCLNHQETKIIMRCLSSVPDGLRKFDEEFKVPLVSSNIGIAHLSSEVFCFTSFIRSNESGQKEEVYDMLKSMVEHDGGTAIVINQYPEWEYRSDSNLKQICKEAYLKLYKKDIPEVITHGGLECALFSDKKPDLDIISIGPSIREIHSARENVSIQSINNVYMLVCEILNILAL